MKKNLRMMLLMVLFAVPWVTHAQCNSGLSCNVTIQMADDYGDGWSGYYDPFYIYVYQNDSLLAQVTLSSGSSGSQTVAVCANDSVRFVFNGSDDYAESSFTILDGGGTTLASGNCSSYTTGALIAAVANACPSCIPPSNPVVSDITTDGATVSWTSSGTASSYLITYGTNTDMVSDTFYTIYSLDANTLYNVEIRSLCSGDTSAPLIATFRTACSVTPCEMGFTLDGYYWGYGYGTVHVMQGGAELASFSSSTDLTVCPGDTIMVQVAASYTWAASNLDLTITDGGGVVIFDGDASQADANGTVAVVADPCPSCLPPSNLTADTIGEDQITVSWTPRSGESEWLVYLNDSLVASASDTTYTFNNLTSNTPYTVKVQAVCSSDDTSNYATLSLRSACGTMTLPYYENWESIAYNGAWPDCWTRILAYNTDPSVNYVYNNTPNGTYSMYLQAYGGTYNMFASSAVPLNGDEISVSFSARLNSGNTAWIKAGVMTNITDTSTFIPLVTITNQNNAFAEYDFNTSSLSSTATYYVAFLSYSEAYYGATGAIDDITISQFSGCGRPNTASVDSVGPYEAYLSWETSVTANSYTVYYGTVNDPADQNLQSVTATDTAVTLTGLLPQTTYYAWVASDCSGTESDYRAFGAFTTELTCASVQNVTLDNVSYTAAAVSWSYDASVGFAPGGAVVTLVDQSDPTVTLVDDVTTGTSYAFTNLLPGHSYRATIRTTCPTTGSTDTAAAVNFTFMTVSCAEISGTDDQTTSYAPTYSYYNYSYVQMIYGADDMPSIDTVSGIAFENVSSNNSPTRTLDVYMRNLGQSTFNGNHYLPVGDSVKVASDLTVTFASGWTTLPFDSVFVYDGTSNLLVTVIDKTGSYVSSPSYSAFSSTGKTLYSYRDYTPYNPASDTTGNTLGYSPKIRFVADCEVPTCFAPMLTLQSVDSNNVTLSWIIQGSESDFLVAQKVATDAAYTMLGNTTDTSYTFANLNANTTYTFMVASICNGDTLRSYLNVRTTCGTMVLPYYEDFEGQTDGAAPACWMQSAMYGTFPSVSNGGYGGGMSMAFASDGANVIAASSPIPLHGDEIYISFWARNDYGTGEVGMMTNPANPSTFLSLVTIPSSNTWTFFEMNTSTLDYDSTYCLAFRYSGSYSFYYMDVDNITIRQDDGCYKAQGVNITNTANTSVSLSWTTMGTVTDYIVYTRLSGDSVWSYAGDTNTTSYTVTGLAGATTYEFRIGTLCTSGDTLWTDPISAQTGCAVITLPHHENFDSYAQDVLPPCWLYDASAITHFDGGIFWRSYTGPSYPAVLPSFNEILSKTEITFKAKLGPVSEGDAILVGVANDQGTFLGWLDTLTNSAQSRSAFVNFSYRYDEYNGSGTRIALGRLYSGGDWALIDSVWVRSIPVCQAVENLTAHNLINPDSISFSWNDSVSSGNWIVYCDTVTMDTSNFVAAYIDTVHLPVYQVPAGYLQGGGKYKFFVRSKCGDMLSDWTIYEFGAGTVIMPASGTDTVEGCGLVIYDNGGPIAGYISQSNSNLVIRPDVAGTQLQVFGGYFNLYSDASATLSIYDGEGATGTPLYTINNTNNQDIHIDSILATSTQGALTVTFSAGVYVNKGYELYVRCLDNSSCTRPSALSAQGVDSSSATMTWTGNASTYHVYHRQAGATSWSMSTVYSNSITFTGLQPQTTYETAVRGICSSSDSSLLSVIASFTTTAGPLPCVAPVINSTTSGLNSVTVDYTSAGNVEAAIMTGAWDDNTTGVQIPAGSYTFTGLTPATTYYIGLRMICEGGNYSDWATATVATIDTSCAMPANVAVANITYTTASVDWSSDANAWEVSYRPVGGSETTVSAATHPVTLTGLDVNTQYFVKVRSVCGNDSYSAWTDEVLFTTPVCTQPNNLTISTITSSSAEIAWTGEPDRYELQYSTGGDTTTVSVNGRFYNMTGLSPNTTYSVRLRSQCSDSAFSSWIASKSFTTKNVGIDAVDGAAVSLYPNPATATTTVTLSGVSGEVCVTIVDLNGRTVMNDVMACEGGCTKTLEVSGLMQGTYFVRLSGEGINAVKKLVVK